MAGNRAASQVKGSESKSDIFFFTHYCWSTSLEKNWFQHFSVLQLQITEGFQVWLLFLVPYLHLKKKNESDILKQNLVLNQLAPTSNPKMKNQKARAPFPNCFFISRPFNLKFFLFSGKFWTVEKFLPSRSEAKK